VRDEQRKRPPITLPGRPVVTKPTEPSPPSPPTTAPRTGWLKLPEGGAPAGYREMDPVDVLPPYTREQLVRMNDRFVHRLQRAFARGRESRTSAASLQPEKRYGGYGMPLALTDDQRLSASSRLLDLKSEETRFKNRKISPTIVADVKRFSHPIKRTKFSAHTAVRRHEAARADKMAAEALRNGGLRACHLLMLE
jgi:hypothetical protein